MKVRVYKNGKEVGWYKDIVPGANAVIATCRSLGFDITEYEFRDYENDEKIVWKGEKNMLEDTKVL